MKIIFTSVLLLTSKAFSAPFGAFTDGNYLYVTVPSDCNKIAARLEVNELCDKNRLTRNLALSCNVKLNIVSTLMYCTAMVHPPKVFVFDLANEQIAPEARELVIQNGDYSTTVNVNRK